MILATKHPTKDLQRGDIVSLYIYGNKKVATIVAFDIAQDTSPNNILVSIHEDKEKGDDYFFYHNAIVNLHNYVKDEKERSLLKPYFGTYCTWRSGDMSIRDQAITFMDRPSGIKSLEEILYEL